LSRDFGERKSANGSEAQCECNYDHAVLASSGRVDKPINCMEDLQMLQGGPSVLGSDCPATAQDLQTDRAKTRRNSFRLIAKFGKPGIAQMIFTVNAIGSEPLSFTCAVIIPNPLQYDCPTQVAFS
jgi:hypothetical protein